jgi:PleD family two-component response regulator
MATRAVVTSISMARDANRQKTSEGSQLALTVRRRLAATANSSRVGVPQHLHVLLIEDDSSYAMLVRQLLLSHGRSAPRVTLTTVEQLSDGLTRLSDRNGIDIVLLDLGLPDSGGLQTLARVRHQAPGVPVVVLTGAADERLALDALQRGAQDYLIKTDTDGEKLVRSIRYAIERQRLLETLANLSLVDDLTGLYNRRGFFILAARQFASGR